MPDSMAYIWDSISGFFYNANGKLFVIVIIILFGVVALVIASVKSIFPKRI